MTPGAPRPDPDSDNSLAGLVRDYRSHGEHRRGDNRSIYATFPDPGEKERLAILKLTWNAGQVTDLNIFAGIGHPLPLRRHRRRWAPSRP